MADSTGRSYRSNLGPTSQAEGTTDVKMRVDRKGELWTAQYHSALLGAAVEGSYMIARTPTPGTGITLTSATGTSYSATNAILGIYNSDTNGSLGAVGQDIIMDFIWVHITAAGTASTSAHWVAVLDDNDRTTGGTLLTNNSVNGNFSANSIISARAGAVTTAAATSSIRILGQQVVKVATAPAFVVDDTIIAKFGAIDSGYGGIYTGTTAATWTLHFPPVVIPPGWNLSILEWAPARTAAQSAEVVVGMIVR